MARENRAAKAIVNSQKVSHLLKQGSKYRFFQILRLLDLSDSVETEASVRIRPSLNLSFPGNDIEGIEKTKDNKYLITANFFGLYGVSSPLPTFYTEDLIREKLDGKTSMRDFLDIIHAQYYPLLYQAWRKNRLWLSVDESQADKISMDKDRALNYLLSFVGLSGGQNGAAQEPKRFLLSFAGLFSHYPRSAAGLQTLLQGLLGGVKVNVVPCISEVAIVSEEDCLLLGKQANKLGESSLVGNCVPQRHSRFDIIVGPLSGDEFLTLLPSSELFIQLLQSIRHYCRHHHNFRLKLLIYPNERQNTFLGKSWSRLGLETWLDGSVQEGELAHIEKPQYNIVSMNVEQVFS